MSLLEIEHLTASYPDQVALRDINLSVEEGEFLCLVGESGSGKSSLVRAITGHPGLEITEGNIYYDEAKLVENRCANVHDRMGCCIGLIPQNPGGSFNPIRNFEKQFRELFRSHGMEMDREKIASVFQAMGLNDVDRILKSRPYEMSGGMNQRIAIAAVMVLSPKLLICDEATSALDVTTSELVIDQLLQIQKDFGITILMVTHNLGLAEHVADRIAIMQKGQLVEQGSCQQIMKEPVHPYTKQLLACAPRMRG